MKSSVLLLGQLALRVYAAAIDSRASLTEPQAIQARSFFGDAPIVKVIWEKNVKTGGSITTLWDADTTNLHAFGCGDVADAGGVSVAVSADDEGYGSLTIGGQAYSIDFIPSNSGGASCSRMYNDEHAVAECMIPATSFSELPVLPLNVTADCLAATQLFEDGLASIPLEDQGTDDIQGDEEPIEVGELDFVSETTVSSPRDIFKRQNSGLCANIDCRYFGHGQTNPPDPYAYCCRSFRHVDKAHVKWRRFVQMGPSISCLGLLPFCFINSRATATHDAKFYGAPKGPLQYYHGEWTYGNLKVKRVHKAEANGFACTGGAWDTVCIGNTHTYQSYMIYTAYFHLVWADDTGYYEVRSPLTASSENKFYCRVNTCGPANHVSWNRVGTGIWPAAR